jgi:transposase
LIQKASAEPGWVVGFADEVWFSRLAQPSLSTWSWSPSDKPVRLYQKERDERDKRAKALACYGLYLPQQSRMLLRFVEGRPVSALTCQFLAWLADQFQRELHSQEITVLVLFWDNASWHVSHQVRQWVGQHNRRVKRDGGLRLLVCPLPKKSPWLNKIESKWVHGKRAVVEPEQVLSPEELADRLCCYYGCEHHEHLKQELC